MTDQPRLEATARTREALVAARDDTPDRAGFDIVFLDDGSLGFFSTQKRLVRSVRRGARLEVRYEAGLRKPQAVACSGRVIWRNTAPVDVS